MMDKRSWIGSAVVYGAVIVYTTVLDHTRALTTSLTPRQRPCNLGVFNTVGSFIAEQVFPEKEE